MRNLLLPFSWIFRLIITLRNFFYDAGWLRSFKFDFPVICIGNLSTGGTGKTPHLLFIANLLQQQGQGAVISRGYRRKSKGFILATSQSLVEDIGDEPKLIKQKNPQLEVAVCENRFMGITMLLQQSESIQYVLMDDGFQHRKVRAGYNIILSAYNKLFIDDRMLPAGNLREPKSSLQRADMVIITKCPPDMPKREAAELRTRLQLLPAHKLFFTSLHYDSLQPLFSHLQNPQFASYNKCLLVSGIASDTHLVTYLKSRYKKLERMAFPDHHYYSLQNLQTIKSKYTDGTILITTEKDAMRFMEQQEWITQLDLRFYVLPVKVAFLFDGADECIADIQHYIHQEATVL